MEEKEKKKKSRFGFGKLLLLILLLIILLPLGLMLVSALDKRDSQDYFPDDVMLYLRVESPEKLLGKMLAMEGTDLAMDPSSEAGELMDLLVSLRKQGILEKSWVEKLISIPVSAALYEEEQFLAALELGVRSVPLRMAAPFTGRILPEIPGLRELDSTGYQSFELQIPQEDEELPPSLFYLGRRGNIIIFSSSQSLLQRAFEEKEHRLARLPEMKEALKKDFTGDIQLLVKTESFLQDLRTSDGMESQILKLLEFPDYAVLDLSLSNKQINLTADLKVETEDSGIESLLQLNSGVPSIINELPQQTEYATVMALGSPKELLEQFDSMLSEEIKNQISQTDRAMKLALGKDMNELLLDWIGREWGVFGIKDFTEPIFFLKVSDEKKRQEVFQHLSSRLIIRESSSLIIDGIRVRQLSMPWFLQSLLESMDVVLPNPYFAVQNDFIYFSLSAEGLASAMSSNKKSQWLVQTPQWQAFSGEISASSSIEIYYSLNRSMPLFLQGDSIVPNILRLYRRGLANLRIEGGQLKLALSAVNTGERGMGPYPGFPLERSKKITSPVAAVLPEQEAVRLYWMEDGRRLVEYQPASGKMTQAELDDSAWLIPHPTDSSLWVVSEKGAVYRYTSELSLLEGYPLLTGLRLSTAPTALGEGLLLPDKEGTLYLLEGTQWSEMISFPSPLLSPVSLSDSGYTALYPKSFLGQIYLFDPQKELVPGWPVKGSGISYGSPFFIPWGDSFMLGFLNQAGDLNIFSKDGEVVMQQKLEGVFYMNPVWAPGAKALYVLSEKGKMYKVNLQGEIEEQTLEGISSQESVLTVSDWNQDGKEEIYLSGIGGSLFAYSPELELLPGFPLPGGMEPVFADLNGDGSLELISGGYDKTLRAYFGQ